MKLVSILSNVVFVVYCCQARRILRMKRAAHLNACATMLQCLYRTRTSRKYFQELKRQALKRKATLLQKNARGFVVRRWVGRLHSRVKAVHRDLMKVGRDLCPSSVLKYQVCL